MYVKGKKEYSRRKREENSTEEQSKEKENKQKEKEVMNKKLNTLKIDRQITDDFKKVMTRDLSLSKEDAW